MCAAAAQLSRCGALQERYIRVMKDNVNLESDFDHVLGQDASQEDVFDLARGNSAAASAALCSPARHASRISSALQGACRQC